MVVLANQDVDATCDSSVRKKKEKQKRQEQLGKSQQKKKGVESIPQQREEWFAYTSAVW